MSKQVHQVPKTTDTVSVCLCVCVCVCVCVCDLSVLNKVSV